MTIAGIVRHLSDGERYWFSNVVAGTDEAARYRPEGPDADFTDYDESTALANGPPTPRNSAAFARTRPV